MPKQDYVLTGDFEITKKIITDEVLLRSSTMAIEDTITYTIDGINISITVFDRFAYFGGGRVSATLTIIEKDNNIKISVISSGGSQAMFWKINTIGEYSLLELFDEVIKPLL